MVSPLGLDAPSTLDALFAGRSGIGARTLFELPGARSTLAAEVRGLVAEADESRTDAMALRAAREALTDAGLAPGASGLGLIVGGTTAGMFETEELLVGLAAGEGEASLGDAMTARLRTHPLSATVDRLVERLGGRDGLGRRKGVDQERGGQRTGGVHLQRTPGRHDRRHTGRGRPCQGQERIGHLWERGGSRPNARAGRDCRLQDRWN